MVNRTGYQSEPPQSERLEYEPLTADAVGRRAVSSWADLKSSPAVDLTECLLADKM